mmetsp:Transcript_5930/g.13785  ORF Transcript_5930/g.13785 Transcript_5930/m.13785 type:complete len:207 (+) Transcript_5930:556-1176(+)
MWPPLPAQQLPHAFRRALRQRQRHGFHSRRTDAKLARCRWLGVTPRLAHYHRLGGDRCGRLVEDRPRLLAPRDRRALLIEPLVLRAARHSQRRLADVAFLRRARLRSWLEILRQWAGRHPLQVDRLRAPLGTSTYGHRPRLPFDAQRQGHGSRWRFWLACELQQRPRAARSTDRASAASAHEQLGSLHSVPALHHLHRCCDRTALV